MATAPYPLVTDIMQRARVRVNDMIISAGGQTLTDDAVFTPSILNLGWQRLQQELVSLGYSALDDEVIIPALAPVATLDPSMFVSLSWTGYSDGVTIYPAVVLPQSLIKATQVWERPTAIGVNLSAFIECDEIKVGGLAAVAKQQWMQQWEWRGNAIFMPGAVVLTDLRIKFAKYLPDLTVAPGIQAPIMRCEDALSGFIAVEFSGSRGDMDRAVLLGEARQATAIIAGVAPPAEPGEGQAQQ